MKWVFVRRFPRHKLDDVSLNLGWANNHQAPIFFPLQKDLYIAHSLFALFEQAWQISGRAQHTLSIIVATIAVTLFAAVFNA